MRSDKQSVCDLVHLLAQHGVQHVVLSPGSRNAPLSMTFEHDARFTTHVVIDERSAGYIALGMAQRLNAPVAICCTSGTAAMNYGPAMAEAHFQGISLIALTCDRPKHRVGQGDGQTIHQSDVFGPHSAATLDLEDLPLDAPARARQWQHMHQTLLALRSPAAAPVHINLHLNEPLYTTDGLVLEPLETKLDAAPELPFDPELKAAFIAACTHANSVLILVAGLPKCTRLNAALKRLAAQPNTLVLTEHTASLAADEFCGTIDRLLLGLSEQGESVFVPEVLVTLGNNIVSKKIKALLRSQADMLHWHVDARRPNMNTFDHLSQALALTPLSFVEAVDWKGHGNYAERMHQWHKRGQALHATQVSQAAFSDLWVVNRVHQSIPSNSHVQMGNSSVVRYFLLDDPRADLVYNGNRGTSGIDGCTSTAIGAHAHGEGQTWLLSGDVAFFYDANAWWNDTDKQGLKVVLINNGGGGIFRIIPGPASTGLLERNFESHHGRTAKHLAAEFDLAYQTAKDKNQTQTGMDWLQAQTGPALLEVFTPRTDNAAVLHAYFETLKTLSHGQSALD